MRIVTISDSVDLPTGLGGQHRILAEALHGAGIGEVIALGFWGSEPLSADRSGFQRIGIGRACMDGMARTWGGLNQLLRPDLVITWGDMRLFHGVVSRRDKAGKIEAWEKQGSFRWMHWYCVDTATFETAYGGMMGLADCLVLPTLFGLKVVRPYLPRVPMAVIPCGVCAETFHPVDDARKQELRRDWGRALDLALEGRRVLLYVDTNQGRKNPYVPVRCMAALPDDVVLVMHCSPQPRRCSEGWDLPALARQWGVEKRIAWTGVGNSRLKLAPEQVASLYQVCDLRVSATQSEGFGVPIIEAGACGIPSVTTRATTCPELLCDEDKCLARVAHWGVQQNGNLERAYVDETDFIEKIKWHLDNPEQSRGIGATIRERVLANFTIPKVKAAWAAEAAKCLEV